MVAATSWQVMPAGANQSDWQGKVQTGTVADAQYLRDGSHNDAKVKWDAW